MRFFRSIRFRLAIWSAFISGIVVLIFSGISLSFLFNEYLDAIDDEMERFAEDLVEELDGEDHFDQDELVKLFDLFDDRKSFHLIAVVSPSGKKLFHSSHWKKRSLALDRDRSSYHKTIIHDGDKWRFSRIKENRWQIFVGSQLDEVFQAQDRMIATFAIVFPLAVILAALGGLLLAHRAMRPVALITKTAKDMSTQELGRRIPDDRLENDELGRLTRVLNAMLSRLESSFEQTARFSADASHELNTPLAIMQGELETALQREEISYEDERLLCNLLDEIQRLKTITNSLLLFSLSDAGSWEINQESFDLSESIEVLIEDVKSLDSAKNLKVTYELEAEIKVRGDQVLIRQAIYNLLKNAVLYNQSSGRVEVSLTRSAHLIKGRICNTGPGISTRNRDRIFDRFFREDTSRTRSHDGFGLGLPLAREIISAHGGDIILVKSDLEETVFEFNLPN